MMSREHFFLPWNASKARLREAENARRNRLEIVKALSQGAVSRRELFKWGLITGAGLIAPIQGLSPFVKSAYADDGGGIPTGAPPSPGTVGLAFTQPLTRLDVLPRNPVATLNPAPTIEANTTLTYNVDPLLGGGIGPVEGRPPGPDWGHQRWDEFLPKVAVEVTQEGAKTNPVGNVPFKFHPSLAAQGPNAMWTFNGTLPPKLILARYGEPILFRHHNKLPADVRQNGGFGRHTLTTHLHNGHHGAENDGFAGAFFFPGQFYDNHYPMILAGYDSINTNATDPRAGSPDDSGGINKVPGDWHETMSTHWFHDHMFSFTAHNVYKGNAGMFNIYSALDRGNEAINDGVNLQLPSGTANSWGNLDYDINLLLADKAWDQAGQLYFDIFNTDGFLGDAMTVNFAYKPYLEVEARKYRFRILNGSVSRFFELALSDSSPMIQIGNDGNLLPQPVTLTRLDEQGIGERYDIVIDFSRYTAGQKVWMVNTCEHQNGAGPSRDLTVAQALAGKSSDPGVGEFLEFRVIPMKAGSDPSKVPATLIPNPDLSKIPVARQRTFAFKDGGSDSSPWTIRTDNGEDLDADLSRVSVAPRQGTREIWKLVNDGGNWDHPIHIHFEEGQILSRSVGDGNSSGGVPAWEKGRKDVYRLRKDGTVTITMQFREFAGMFMEHCHNTVHEDHAMLLRYEVGRGLVPLPTPSPTPQGVKFISTTVLKGAFSP
jgi:FtsP/CotA-like multicopper oxidase with cupredoxin domain